MFGRMKAFGGGNNLLFSANFGALSIGSRSASTFLTETGLSYTRADDPNIASIATLQTSASTIESGIALNRPCIGSNGTNTGLVIQPITGNLLGVAGDNSPRNLNTAWSAGSSVVVTSNAIAGPDGLVQASQANVSSGGFAPFTTATADPRTFSSWQRSVVSDPMQMVWNNAAINTGLVITAVGSATWQRLKLSTNGTPHSAIDVCDCRNYSGVGGTNNQARNVYVDFIQYEAGNYATEAIPVGQRTRQDDRLSYGTASSLVDSGRLKFYASFYPKFASSVNVISSTSVINTAWMLLSYTESTTNKTLIWIDGTSGNPRKLNVQVNGAAAVASTNSFSWSENDLVEIYIEIGANLASVAKYKINGGSFNDLVLGTFTTSLSPTGSMGIFWDNTTGSTTNLGQMPCRLKEIRFYKHTFAGL